ncbi:phosphatidylglycerophosphatase A [Solimonas sp. K1W22B-7]|uniref:phosphatidylglycerophosphatase A family protein n=1 Tax=Solimonas sp. K1W22B-7 TaxID=2303331 RepID=UPI000E32FB23|nr:phosphatidylglycerophosphatase A [Solimonas sp. K1W22B-7]AXQ29630.1 phosphatidylglycerophosphatase A [Solimonas sp. K1W22B-7]
MAELLPKTSAFPRPPRELVMSTPEHFIAFGFGAGLAPKAPGTVGTLVGLPFWLALMWLPPWAFVAAVLVLFLFGCWVCGESARLLGVHDYGGIVFDEIVGFLVTCLPLLPALGLVQGHMALWLLAAFAVFRLFDILKPWPIRAFDRSIHGGLGIMLDDILAGLFGAAVLYGASLLL